MFYSTSKFLWFDVMIYTDDMDPKSFYGRRMVPLSATWNVGGDVGGSDDENFTESDEEYLPQPQHCDIDEDRDESRDSRKI